MSKLTLSAPLSGWVTALEDVPDAAFAERMVGDGAAIDPIDSMLLAPCDGEVVSLADACHAVTIRADNGAEILMHVGIDTVGLHGAGLRAHVTRGQRVRRGEALLGLDLDRLVYGAKSLVTPVVVTNAEAYGIKVLLRNGCVAAGDAFIDIASSDSEPAKAKTATPLAPDAVRSVTVRFEHGIHARPAARIARASKTFDARITVSGHGREADARSATALMALGVRCGDSIELRGYGPGAASAIRELAAEFMAATGISRDAPPPAKFERSQPTARNANEIRGTVASRGIAVGVAQRFAPAEIRIRETGGDAAQETAELERAIGRARDRLRQMLAASDNDILAAHVELLEDPGLLGAARSAIARGKSAGRAWQMAVAAASDTLTSTGDTRLAERTADLRDVEAQVLEAFDDREAAAVFKTAGDAIILAVELLPSQLARLDLGKVAGICSADGGPTSHVALLAASLGIPALVGAGPAVLDIADGAPLIVDADEGILYMEPSVQRVESVRRRLAERRRKSAAWLQDAAADCYTADGCRIEIFANLASEADAIDSVRKGAEGCGLLRTEFLFLNRATPPQVDEQAAEYQKIANALAPRPLVIRTLDAGGDKLMAYLPLPREENPLLGLRGLRSGLLFPRLMRDQLTAILKVLPPSQCRILLPMVTDADEIRSVRTVLDELIEEQQLTARPSVGAMIETPASVVMAESLAREVDFFSVGSNDLAQYTLAMDRSHPQLADRFDAFHPAILRQIGAVCRAAEAANRPVSVCGALASEPLAAGILIGLGVRVLSAVPGVIPEIKASVRRHRLEDCEKLARAVLGEDSAATIRKLAEDFHTADPA